METASTSTPKHMLRVLLAGGVLALGWAAIDMVVHSEPAAAAETIDLLPLADDTLDSVTGAVNTVVSEIVAPVTVPLVNEVVNPIVTPVVTPVVDTVISPIATPVIEPLVPVIQAATDPLAPVLVAVLEPVVPVFEALPITQIAPVAQAIPSLTAITPNQGILTAGGAVLVSTLIAVVAAPLLPAPGNGGPLNAPLAPAAPTGSTGSAYVGFYGELNSGIIAGIGAIGTSAARSDAVPASPTFDSDTTPD